MSSYFASPLTDTNAARSVLDYETTEQLRAALEEAARSCPGASTTTGSTGSETTNESLVAGSQTALSLPSASADSLLDPQYDWVLSGANPEMTQDQSLEQEFHRLLTLKSYDLLDIESDPTMERITAMTGRMLNCPIAYVGTMDLGRYNILAGKGLGTLKNVHRKGTFCEHVIQATSDVVVIEDASKNPYMQDNWFVAHGPKTRFYAAARLIGPEGYVLGTLCVIDPKPRPEGLSLSEKQNLMELADMTVDYLVQRKKALLMGGTSAQRVASAAHDLITPLTGIDLNLSLLNDDHNLTDTQKELLKNASRCVSVVKGICRSLLQDAKEAVFTPANGCCDNCQDDQTNNDNNEHPTQHQHQHTGDQQAGIVKMDQLVQKISTIMEHHPKQVPLVVSVEPDVPNEIMSHDLKLFRSAMNYLSVACNVTQKGLIQFRISKTQDAPSSRPILLFECEDTSQGIPVEQYPKLFQKPQDCPTPGTMSTEFGLYSVALHMIHMGGEYGYRPPTEQRGSTLWFSIPLFLPDARHRNAAAGTQRRLSVRNGSEDHHKRSSSIGRGACLDEAMKEYPFPSVASEMLHGSLNASSAAFQDRTKTALVIEDTVVIRKTLSRCLSKLGYEVQQAENGFVGLQKLKEAMYDLVLCDFLMPVLDGVDCVEQFRAWEAKHRSDDFQQLIVGISAHCQDKDIQLGIQAGMNDFRPKPVTMKDLKALQESSAVKDAGRKLDRIMAQEHANVVTGGGDEAPMSVFNCLIGAESNSNYPQLVKTLDPKKWKVVVVHDGMDALKLLKIQNWDLVILDDDLPRLSGSRCALRFREWEKCHRINRQRNMVLASAYLNASKLDANRVLLPYGFEHAVEKPFHMEACQTFILQTEQNYTASLTGMDIIAH